MHKANIYAGDNNANVILLITLNTLDFFCIHIRMIFAKHIKLATWSTGIGSGAPLQFNSIESNDKTTVNEITTIVPHAE